MSIIILEKGVIMKYIIKRNINLFGKNNIIKFGYNVKINKMVMVLKISILEMKKLLLIIC